MSDSQRGHTLIELMVALSLVGILAVLAVQNLGSRISHYSLRHAGQQLAADLRTIRQKAITEGFSHKIRFMPDLLRYDLPGIAERSLPSQIRFGLNTNVPRLPDTGSIPSDGISFVENKVTFQPNGTIVGLGGTVYLTDDSARHDTLAVTVNVTGRVKIYRWNGEKWK